MNKDSKKPDPALAPPCPKCGAAAGSKCKNYLGKGKFTCKERKEPVSAAAPTKRRNVTPSLFGEAEATTEEKR